MAFIFLGTTTLNRCERLGDGQAQAVSQVPPVPRPQPPQAPDATEAAPNEEPVTWLDDTENADVKELDWDALIPEDWRLDVLMDQYNADEISDDDPRAQELFEKLKALW